MIHFMVTPSTALLSRRSIDQGLAGENASNVKPVAAFAAVHRGAKKWPLCFLLPN
jgi:hypothetical protein